MLKRINHYSTFYMLSWKLSSNSLISEWISFRRSRILISLCQIYTRFSNSFKTISNLSTLKRIFLKVSSLSSIKRNSLRMLMRQLLHQIQITNLTIWSSVSVRKNIIFRNALTLWKAFVCQTGNQIWIFRNRWMRSFTTCQQDWKVSLNQLENRSKRRRRRRKNLLNLHLLRQRMTLSSCQKTSFSCMFSQLSSELIIIFEIASSWIWAWMPMSSISKTDSIISPQLDLRIVCMLAMILSL